MNKQTTPREISKFQRYRTNQRDKGMKLLRVWITDPHNSEFAKSAKKQASLLNGRVEEKEALNFIAEAFDWPEV